jgi:hypothetical protein
MSDLTVSVAGPADISAFVASVTGLFHEDGGRHDRFLDTQWPVREGESPPAHPAQDVAAGSRPAMKAAGGVPMMRRNSAVMCDWS